MTTTVCIRGMSREEIEAAGIVYVGRPNPRRGLRGHALANPFKVGRDGQAGECVDRFRAYLLSRPDLCKVAKWLRGRVLGCWCEAGTPCHAKVIAEVADGPPRCKYCGEVVEKEGEIHVGGCGKVG
jgi:hypothetical protein